MVGTDSRSGTLQPSIRNTASRRERWNRQHETQFCSTVEWNSSGYGRYHDRSDGMFLLSSRGSTRLSATRTDIISNILQITPTLNERYGRKKMFMLIASIGIVGATIQAASTVGPRFWVLVVGKIVLNISVGIASGCVGK